MGRKQMWVDMDFNKFVQDHKLELKDITKQKRVSDTEATRYITKKYSFRGKK